MEEVLELMEEVLELMEQVLELMEVVLQLFKTCLLIHSIPAGLLTVLSRPAALQTQFCHPGPKAARPI